jgi:peptide/nickel transport system substrate-binding protein
LAAAFALVLTAVLCWPGGSPYAQKRGGQITVAVDEEAKGWDPHNSTAFSSFTFYEHVYECPVRYDAKGEIEASLAESWEVPDNKTLIFNLRKGVKFHNGREMVADDFVYSFNRLKHPDARYPTMWEAIESMNVVNKYKVRFNLSQPDPIMLRNMAHCRFAAIVPKEVVEANGDLNSTFVGTGPWKVKEYVPGDFTVYERFGDYWEKGRPLLDSMKFQIIKDEVSRLSALRKGSVHVGWVKEAHMAATAKKESSLQVDTPPPSRRGRFFFNMNKPPFDNMKLRQAVAAAIDWDAIVNNVLFGFGQKTAAIPPSAGRYALPQAEVEKLRLKNRNPDLARQLLREAGHPNGFSFTIMTSEHGPDYTAAPQIIQSSLAEVGIQAKIELVEWGIHLKRWRACDFTTTYLGGVWFADPDPWIRPFVHSKGNTNCGYSNPQVDRLMDESRNMMDVERRVAVWHDIQRILEDEQPILFLMVGPPRFEIIANSLHGYQFLPQISRFNLKNAWLDK